MARIAYIDKNFKGESLDMIQQANAICAEYDAQGLTLTLRQLYYQFVARGLLANRQQNYKRLGSILNDARMAGKMDWDYLVDRTRNLSSLAHWDSPAEIIDAVANQYRTDLWQHQPTRVEVWIEKDAGIGVIEGVCERNDVPYFSCRGYTSVSEIWSASQRLGRYTYNQDVVILHIGDHDPSGIDMSRDIEDRLRLFIHHDFGTSRGLEVRRIALNYDQVQQYNPPPNPAKQTDARFQRYVEDTGLYESWELDALDPVILQDLIQEQIDGVKDDDLWVEHQNAMFRERDTLQAVSSHWGEVVDHCSDNEWIEDSGNPDAY